MRIALISDIHGNRWALAAVLEHIARQRVDAIVDDADPRWEVACFRIAYDWDSAAACAERNHRPEWAHALRTGFALRA